MKNIFDNEDWVYVNTDMPVQSKVQKVVSVHDINGYYLVLDLNVLISANRVRYATEEEIKREKERRLKS
ncbi:MULTISPECIES: hypothetical protein [Bacillus cereus group]|uniref:hypothetical protein n=1 Tax=Bacillus cereus group TaxID=86661 RepID=UPI002E1DEE4B|nr:hypothetical protein [Bacillus mobilis]